MSLTNQKWPWPIFLEVSEFFLKAGHEPIVINGVMGPLYMALYLNR